MAVFSQPNHKDTSYAFWSISAQQHLKHFETSPKGLGDEEAGRRIKRYGANQLNNKHKMAVYDCSLPSLKALLF